ncbi:MAG: hypothetical protein JWM04_582, partial [Verrucomicrobiales bacterium]|nr:hypothetical protein [Verrucomicrobiales bacterium]
MRLFIYVEGQEEEMFVNRVLREYLRPFGVIVQKPILAATSFRLGSNEEEEVTVGGVTNYNAIRQDILNLFENAEIGLADILTTFVDLYALPHSFPGAEETRLLGIVGAKKSKHIEAEWQKDIGRPNFHPYIQVHEFEALILTRPSVLKDYYPEHSLGITE